jgi:nitroimidazol reductase NimA-like FMN-containing flavoprotein (pyridoxamine 5'-phosphate oxidase superfamily)
VDEIAADDQWRSLIAIGRYEELPETSGSDGVSLGAQERPWHDSRHRQWNDEGCDDERERAWELLKRSHPVWWEPGCTAWAARTHRDPAEPLILVYYRILIDRLTGHEATRNPKAAIPYAVPAHPAGRSGWLRRTLMRVYGGAEPVNENETVSIGI